MSQAFFNQLLEEDDLSWKTLIVDAVRDGEMDPWDVDLSFIASNFIKQLADLKQMNFKISGKVVLASALLLKLKSQRFISNDMDIFDQLLNDTEDDDYSVDEEEYSAVTHVRVNGKDFKLTKRTPQDRKRKVSVYDLIDALEKALNTNKRKQVRSIDNAPEVHIPTKTYDMTESMDKVHLSVSEFYAKENKQLTFSQLIPSESREDKITTFVPLLHLVNAKKVDLHQAQTFADFHIELMDPSKEIEKELSE